MNFDEEWLYRIALTSVPHVGAVHAKRLEQHFGSCQAVFEADKQELMQVERIGEKVCEHLLDAKVLDHAKRECEWMVNNEVNAYFYADEAYPKRLRPYHDAPFVLYCKGSANLNALRTVGIVGTRKPTHLGVSTCEQLVSDLQPYEASIISGLAFGIDITAHRKAVSCNMSTIGVLASGLASVYPPSHRRYAQEILAHGGALVSEFPSQTLPDRERFPMRNRIIAGLSDALVVVETARRGGSMISAQFANQYNKDVFAVPGRLNDEKSAGCHLLIKSHRAALLENADDIGYVMQWEKLGEKRALQQELFVQLNAAEQQVVHILKEKTQVSVDALQELTGLPVQQLSATLLSLEFKELVKMVPGSRYVLR